jgi:hypothetical protein
VSVFLKDAGVGIEDGVAERIGLGVGGACDFFGDEVLETWG